MTRRLAILALCAGLTTAIAPACAAQDYGRPSFGAGRGDQDQARDGARSGRQTPLARVLAAIAARNPGRHLNTTMGDFGGIQAYFVQWQMPDGRVVIFIVDAATGQIIGRQGG